MSEQAIDLEEFLERVQDDKELLLELLDIFTEDYQEKRVLLQEAVDSNNCEEVKSIAHSLKGASGNISAKALREVFIKLEIMGEGNDISAAGDLWSELDKGYEDLLACIGQLKEKLSA